MRWRNSYTYTIDSHPYTLGQIQVAGGSASNTSSYRTCVIGWKPLFCLLIIPASDIHSTLLSSQSLIRAFIHSFPKWTLSAYCVTKSVLQKGSPWIKKKKQMQITNDTFWWGKHLLTSINYAPSFRCSFIQIWQTMTSAERVSQMFPIMLVCKVWETE